MHTASFTDIIKENTSKVLRELELQTPTHFQIYSDMYKEYLHMMDNVFGMLVLSEREFIDRIGTDPKLAASLRRAAGKTTDDWLVQLDNYGEFLQWYAKTRSQGMKSFDRYMHSMISAHAQMVASTSRWQAAFNEGLEDAPDDKSRHSQAPRARQGQEG